MLVPETNQNIYPTTEENVRAILNFYFELPDGELDWLFAQKKLQSNQIEFIARQVTDKIAFFQEKVGNGLTISNLMKYGVDALTKIESEWGGSQNRKNITREFRSLVERSDDLNFRHN